ncbi:MAG: hypothetical protein HZA48_00545 [Planctomycetes bacterium]|nr:hypothetical protein [Planctomycetota bacterium]
MEQQDLIKLIADSFASLGVAYFITGSTASIIYGEPRFTNDIDIVADISEAHINDLIKKFPLPEFYLSEEAIKDAVNRKLQFNIIHPSSGLKIDVIVKKNNLFDESRFKRLRKIQTSNNIYANFASPEDVIVKKMDFYRQGGSEKHLRDIAGIIKISGENLDYNYITNWANKLDLDDICKAILNQIKMK